jgi:hypothetical protein
MRIEAITSVTRRTTRLWCGTGSAREMIARAQSKDKWT